SGGGQVYLNTRSFTNAGTASLDGQIIFNNSSSLTNAAGATFNVLTNGIFLYNADSTTPTFSNAGSFNAQAAAGETATDAVSFTNTNTGTVNVSSGTLTLADPGGMDSGPFTVAQGGTLDLDETAGTFTSTSSISGAGAVVISGGTITIPGTL